MELMFKVYNSKRYGMSESKGLINFAADIINKKSEEEGVKILVSMESKAS